MSRPRTTASIARQMEKSYLKSKRQLEESMEGLPKTCKAYLDRVLALAKLAQNFREERASRGLDPVNLGNAARTVYSFKATIDELSAAPLDEERARFEEEMEAQFPSDYPQRRADQQPAPGPAAPVKQSKKKRSSKQ